MVACARLSPVRPAAVPARDGAFTQVVERRGAARRNGTPPHAGRALFVSSGPAARSPCRRSCAGRRRSPQSVGTWLHGVLEDYLQDLDPRRVSVTSSTRDVTLERPETLAARCCRRRAPRLERPLRGATRCRRSVARGGRRAAPYRGHRQRNPTTASYTSSRNARAYEPGTHPAAPSRGRSPPYDPTSPASESPARTHAARQSRSASSSRSPSVYGERVPRPQGRDHRLGVDPIRRAVDDGCWRRAAAARDRSREQYRACDRVDRRVARRRRHLHRAGLDLSRAAPVPAADLPHRRSVRGARDLVDDPVAPHADDRGSTDPCRFPRGTAWRAGPDRGGSW